MLPRALCYPSLDSIATPQSSARHHNPPYPAPGLGSSPGHQLDGVGVEGVQAAQPAGDDLLQLTERVRLECHPRQTLERRHGRSGQVLRGSHRRSELDQVQMRRGRSESGSSEETQVRLRDKLNWHLAEMEVGSSRHTKLKNGSIYS